MKKQGRLNADIQDPRYRLKPQPISFTNPPMLLQKAMCSLTLASKSMDARCPLLGHSKPFIANKKASERRYSSSGRLVSSTHRQHCLIAGRPLPWSQKRKCSFLRRGPTLPLSQCKTLLSSIPPNQHSPQSPNGKRTLRSLQLLSLL